MHFRAGKTNLFSVFHVENSKIQPILWFYVCFNVEICVTYVKKQTFSTIYVRFLRNYHGFSGKKG